VRGILTRAMAFALLAAASLPAGAQQIAPMESLLPNTTKGVFLVADVPQLVQQWEKTQLGELMADPVMDPFAKDLRRQFEDRLSRVRERLGLELADVKGVPGGAMAAAVIEPVREKTAVAFLMDVTGHVPQAQVLLDKVAANLTRQGAVAKQQTLQGTTLMVFDVPKTEESPAVTVSYLLSGNLLAASDDVAVMEGILKRHLGQASPGGTLADLPAFRAVMARCQKHAGREGQIRWFVEPLGYVESLRAATPEDKRRTGTTILDVVQNQGFDAVRGIGGFLDLATDGYEVIHRTAVYAPPPYRKAPPPYQDKVSMDMFVLPNHVQFTPPTWVPNDIATCTTFYWDIQKAFDNFGPIFDEVAGGLDYLFKADPKLRADLDAQRLPDALRKEFDDADVPLAAKAQVFVEDPGHKWRIASGKVAYVIKGVGDELKVYLANTGLWADLLHNLRTEENGPQIDLAGELIAHLGQRVTVVTDYELPITTTSERLLFAIEARDAEALARGVAKYFANDRTMEARRLGESTIWVTVEDSRHRIPDDPVISNLPDLAPARPKDGARPGRRLGQGDQEQDLLPHKAVAVVHGHLMIASHYDFLVKILQGSKEPDPLTASIDYRVVQGALERLGVGESCLRSFSRTDEEYRPTYELIRLGKMPQSEMMFGRMLNALLGPRKRGAVRQQKVDGQEMPEYEVVRHYLGPAGGFAVSEPDGWFVGGFMLKR